MLRQRVSRYFFPSQASLLLRRLAKFDRPAAAAERSFCHRANIQQTMATLKCQERAVADTKMYLRFTHELEQKNYESAIGHFQTLIVECQQPTTTTPDTNAPPPTTFDEAQSIVERSPPFGFWFGLSDPAFADAAQHLLKCDAIIHVVVEDPTQFDENCPQVALALRILLRLCGAGNGKCTAFLKQFENLLPNIANVESVWPLLRSVLRRKEVAGTACVIVEFSQCSESALKEAAAMLNELIAKLTVKPSDVRSLRYAPRAGIQPLQFKAFISVRDVENTTKLHIFEHCRHTAATHAATVPALDEWHFHPIHSSLTSGGALDRVLQRKLLNSLGLKIEDIDSDVESFVCEHIRNGLHEASIRHKRLMHFASRDGVFLPILVFISFGCDARHPICRLVLAHGAKMPQRFRGYLFDCFLCQHQLPLPADPDLRFTFSEEPVSTAFLSHAQPWSTRTRWVGEDLDPNKYYLPSPPKNKQNHPLFSRAAVATKTLGNDQKEQWIVVYQDRYHFDESRRSFNALAFAGDVLSFVKKQKSPKVILVADVLGAKEGTCVEPCWVIRNKEDVNTFYTSTLGAFMQQTGDVRGAPLDFSIVSIRCGFITAHNRQMAAPAPVPLAFKPEEPPKSTGQCH